MGLFRNQQGGCCCICCACHPRNANTVIIIPGRGKQRSQVVKVPGDANVVVVRKNDDKPNTQPQQEQLPAPEKHKNTATSPSACNEENKE